jgi:MHS family alpha-ketoglutarate permease-like MFS transporter
VRALGVSLPYAITNALFGGTAEYIAIHGADHFYFYDVTTIVAVSLAAALGLPDLRVKGYLDGTDEIER